MDKQQQNYTATIPQDQASVVMTVWRALVIEVFLSREASFCDDPGAL